MPIRVFFCDAMVADSQSFSPTRTSLRRSFARGSVSTDGGRGEDLRVAFQSDVSVDKTQALGYIGSSFTRTIIGRRTFTWWVKVTLGWSSEKLRTTFA